jgi:hypothetical protein
MRHRSILLRGCVYIKPKRKEKYAQKFHLLGNKFSAFVSGGGRIITG